MTNKQDPFTPPNYNEDVVEQIVEQAPIKKEAIKQKPPPIKYQYDVKIETMLPATLTYRILAETPQQAAELIKGRSPNSVAHKLIGRKDLVLKVYDGGGLMMRFMKRLLG